ncbi:MAG TPA: ThiF family adenylyltransferase, partial [Gemmataceae bacterium]|nr:ThiF family adenylyltransferase [Gemmataceae bacterium]
MLSKAAINDQAAADTSEMVLSGWSYNKAFCRNQGLISPEEQEILRNSRVAVAGLGGVGGIDLVTLARLGIGRFTIADPDVFELANTNRQFGATQITMGQSKAEVMADIVYAINPDADIRVYKDSIGPENAEEFLETADLLVDGIEAFNIDVRRLLFRHAARKGIYALGAGPVGFSTAWVIFDPKGMSFDKYFGLSEDMDPLEQFAAYIVGMAPGATQRAYMDGSGIDVDAQTGPSLSLACQLAAGVVAAEVVKILLKRGSLR